MPKDKNANRPTNEELLKLLETKTLREIGEIYQVSKQAVCIWKKDLRTAPKRIESPRSDRWKHGELKGRIKYGCKCQLCLDGMRQAFIRYTIKKYKIVLDKTIEI